MIRSIFISGGFTQNPYQQKQEASKKLQDSVEKFKAECQGWKPCPCGCGRWFDPKPVEEKMKRFEVQ